MKMQPSLKLYLIAMMIFTGITTIVVMSIISANYFIAGIDMPLNHHMRAQAFVRPVKDGRPMRSHDFIVATRWQDLPKQITSRLKEQDAQEGKLLKSLDGNPFFSEPKAGYFVMKLTRAGETRYVASMFERGPKHISAQSLSPHFIDILIIALLAILLFSIVPYLIMRQVTKPVGKLMAWTSTLSPSQLVKQPPDFQYNELNKLADLVRSSLISVQESLQREQEFLGYASHELRTPIAVTRTNSELLRKMVNKSMPVAKQLQVIERIERASLTMSDLTETLLWLNRQSDKSLPETQVCLGELIQQLLDELNYLQQNKQITVSVEVDDYTQQLPEALCRIILTNLIRNAIQHTQQGSITIKQQESFVSINNQEEQESEIKDNLGFGLGLELTKRLVQHYGWQYSNIYSNNGHKVEIDFSLITATKVDTSNN